MLKFFERRRWISLPVTIIIAIAIFYISSLTFKPGVSEFDIIPVIYHFLAFFWLSFFLVLALIKGKRKNLFLLAVFIASVYAVSDEIHQSFVPGRDSSFIDFLTDSAGILFASFLYALSFKRKIRKKI